MAKQYRATIDNLVERGVVHAKGKTIMVELSEDRAANLVRAGYIEEILPEAPKAAAKAIEEPPQNKMVNKGDAATKNDATGLAAKLKEKNKKK